MKVTFALLLLISLFTITILANSGKLDSISGNTIADQRWQSARSFLSSHLDIDVEVNNGPIIVNGQKCISNEVCMAIPGGSTKKVAGENEFDEKKRAETELASKTSKLNPSSLCLPSIPPCSKATPYLKKYYSGTSAVVWEYCVQCQGSGSGSLGGSGGSTTTTAGKCPDPGKVNDNGVYESNINVAATSVESAKKIFDNPKSAQGKKLAACNAKISVRNSLTAKCSDYCTTKGNTQCGSKLENPTHSCSVTNCRITPGTTSGRAYLCDLRWDSSGDCSCPTSSGA